MFLLYLKWTNKYFKCEALKLQEAYLAKNNRGIPLFYKEQNRFKELRMPKMKLP